MCAGDPLGQLHELLLQASVLRVLHEAVDLEEGAVNVALGFKAVLVGAAREVLGDGGALGEMNATRNGISCNRW